MTKEQIEELKRLDRAPDGSCWYCKTVMRGHFDGCPVATLPRLLEEREKLLEALRGMQGQLDGMRDFVCPDGGAESLYAARAAIAFAEGAAP